MNINVRLARLSRDLRHASNPSSTASAVGIFFDERVAFAFLSFSSSIVFFCLIVRWVSTLSLVSSGGGAKKPNPAGFAATSVVVVVSAGNALDGFADFVDASFVSSPAAFTGAPLRREKTLARDASSVGFVASRRVSAANPANAFGFAVAPPRAATRPVFAP